MNELFESYTEDQTENRYLENKEKAWERYWNALMGQCYAEQAEQEEYVEMATKKTTK